MSQHSVEVIVISNAGKGFGRSIALSYGLAGYDVVCIDDEVDLASKTAAEIEDQGGKAIPIQADISSSMDVRKAFDKVYEIFGTFAGIIHVASFENKSRFISLTEAEFAETVSKGLKSSFLVLRTAARFIEDVWVVIVTPPSSGKEPHMVASRGAIVELSKSFKNGYPNLRINVVTPSRQASDSKHDAILVENVRYLSNSKSGLSGHHLEIELPPPPKVVESLLPEVQAALDDDVRQADLEADLYEFISDEEDDDGLIDDELNDFDEFEDESIETSDVDLIDSEDAENGDSEYHNEYHNDDDYSGHSSERHSSERHSSELSADTEFVDATNIIVDDGQKPVDSYFSDQTDAEQVEDESYLSENYDLKLIKDVERINRKDGD